MLLLFLHNIIETLDSKLILKIVTNSANKNRYNNIIQTYLDEAYMVLLKWNLSRLYIVTYGPSTLHIINHGIYRSDGGLFIQVKIKYMVVIILGH